ncbi:MAG: hypothetical protein KY467_05600 [Gemmatimonadetes bacterium]|nr:hypothetical protein [Gemmatimonadota bacterium]
MALTGGGGQFGGPRYTWGGQRNVDGAGGGGSRRNANSGLNSGRYTAGPEAGMRRGAWQWQGHGPSAQRDYGWDYQGGVGRDEITQRTGARTGGSYLSHMAQDRSGGLPRYSQDYDIGERVPRGERGGRGYARDFDRGGRSGSGGYSGGGMGGYGGGGEYDRGDRASGGTLGGSGNRHGGGDTGFRGGLAPAFGGEYGVGNHFADRYDRELRARDGHAFGGGDRYAADYGRGNRGQIDRGADQEVTYGSGSRQGGGGYPRDFGPGRGYGREFRQGGDYGRDFGEGRGHGARPLTDNEFYSRVNRW